jgi:hypothetical protein
MSLVVSPKDVAIEVHRRMSADEHMSRSRALLDDARSEPDGERALILMQASQLHVRYAEDPDWRD